MAKKKNARSKPIRTPEAVLSFPNLITARAYEDQPAKFSCTFLFPPGTDLSELEDAVTKVAMEQFDGKRPKNYRSPFRDVADMDNPPEGYEEGWTFIRASSKQRPGVVGPDAKTRIDDPADIYPGCRVMGTVVAFGYDVKGNKGVSFGLNNVQKRGEGTPLGSFSRAEDDFDAVEDWNEDGDDKAAPDEGSDPDFLK